MPWQARPSLIRAAPPPVGNSPFTVPHLFATLGPLMVALKKFLPLLLAPLLLAGCSTITNLTPEFKKTGDYLMNVFANQSFESEGAIYGMKWPELNQHYRLWKAKAYPGKGILERTGISQRHIVDNGMATSDLAVEAGRAVLTCLESMPSFAGPAVLKDAADTAAAAEIAAIREQERLYDEVSSHGATQGAILSP